MGQAAERSGAGWGRGGDAVLSRVTGVQLPGDLLWGSRESERLCVCAAWTHGAARQESCWTAEGGRGAH